MNRVLKVVAISLFAAVVSSPSFAQSNPLVGAWKLNTAKSTFDPGPAPQSLTRVVAADGDGVKYDFTGVDGSGKPMAYGFAVKFDDKDNPVSGSVPNGADTISAKRIDANNYVATLKKGGKVVGVSKVSVSKDGKSTTVDIKGTNAAGVKTHDVQVYDKQ
jgi:hypothetical protein